MVHKQQHGNGGKEKRVKVRTRQKEESEKRGKDKTGNSEFRKGRNMNIIKSGAREKGQTSEWEKTKMGRGRKEGKRKPETREKETNGKRGKWRNKKLERT